MNMACQVSTYQSEPAVSIKLLEKDGNNLKINERALSVLSRINGPVCPCVIMGQYRTGKSFLLNRLFEIDSGFSVGHTDKPETKGIWISSKTSKVHNKTLNKEMNVIFIDTEVINFI